MTHGRQLPYGINETDSNGDVPSPKTNIPQNGNGVNTIVYEKAVDGSFYVVEAVPDSKYKTLWVETAYMKKEKPSHEPDERFRSPGKTSETNILPTSQTGDVPSPETNIPQNGNGVNTLDAENSAAKVQQNTENAEKVQQRKPGTVSAEQMYGVKFSQENKCMPL